MPATRHFLDWTTPAPIAVRDRLLGNRPPGNMDLAGCLIVTPTRQSGRRLSEALVRQCETEGATLLDAKVIQPSYFLQPAQPHPHPPITPLAAQLLWMDLLAGLQDGEALDLFPNRPSGARGDWALRNARTLHNLRHTTAEAGFSLAGVYARFGETLEEAGRWRDLALLEQRYLDLLTPLAVADPLASALAAAENPAVPEGLRRIVIACVPDPTPLVMRAWERLAAQTDIAIEILIHAPSRLADAFDAWGRPIPEYWTGAIIPIPDPEETIRVAENPAGQSQLVVRRIAALRDRFAPSETAIGVPDTAVVRHLIQDLQPCGIAVFDPADRPISRHPLYTLVEAFGELYQDAGYKAFSRLARHPDWLAFLDQSDQLPGFSTAAFLQQLDDFQQRYLPVDDDALASILSNATAAARDFPLLGPVTTLLKGFLDPDAGTAPHHLLRQFLLQVYAHRELHAGNLDDAVFEAVAGIINQALSDLGAIPSPAASATGTEQRPRPLLPALLAHLREQQYHPIREDSLIDLDGWLELPWNPAPHCIVTGMNEGCVPDGHLGDAYLPNSLRETLGLRSDRTRYARDAYLLSALIACRRETGSVMLILGKTGATGDPLRPSRLLFRCDDADLPARAQHIFRPLPPEGHRPPARISFTLDPSPPRDLRAGAMAFTRIPVTAFRDYLACPFRFYLRHVLGMDRQDYQAGGMDARAFGSLLHHALERMAEEKMGSCTDPARLSDFLCSQLDACLHDTFGHHPSLMVRMQAEAARQRLIHAAQTQAALAMEGWEIVHTEIKRTETIGTTTVVGKIDRIDRHRDTGCWRILDYKSFDNAESPAKTHLGPRSRCPHAFAAVTVAGRERAWVDLQLPLYAFLARALTGDAPVELGYFSLPKAVTETGLSLWKQLDANLIASGLSCAEQVVAGLHAGRFWPPVAHVRYDRFEPLFPGAPEACMTPPRLPEREAPQ